MLDMGTFQVFALSDASLYIASHTHRWVPVKLDFLACKESINLLQCKVASLGVEVVDKG